MYRCIIFTKLYPLLSLDHEQAEGFYKEHGVCSAEDSTPESAMVKAAKDITHMTEVRMLGSILTWQPSSGKVFLNGVCCGVVFKVEQ